MMVGLEEVMVGDPIGLTAWVYRKIQPPTVSRNEA
jgi:hypothetical protein